MMEPVTVEIPIMPVLFDLAPSYRNYYDLFSNYLTRGDPLLNFLKIIAGCDSLHDFDDNGGRVPSGSVWDTVSSNLLQNLNSLITPPRLSSTFAEWTAYASNRSITPSSIEDKTVSYFESNFKAHLRGETTLLTYKQVIDAIKTITASGVNINDAILQANRELCNTAQILEIDMEAGEVWDMAYTTQDKMYIGLFLLNFYFPPPPPTSGDNNSDYNTKLQTYMTFDAGSNIPSKIFGLLNQVINLVTPLNIADSATEGQHLAVDISQKRAGVKNKYVFPINAGNKYVYSSNIFTMPAGLQLFITPPSGEYGETNKYNFNINVYNPNPSPTNCELVKFTTGDGKTYKSGPGVQYLSECIANGFNRATPAISTVAPIANNCSAIIPNDALYFDLKRSGDWEQCLAALTVNKLMEASPQKGRVILCTIDRLCGLFSRCIGQNTLYHYGTRLVLYKYNVNLTAAEAAAGAAAAAAAAEREAANARDVAFIIYTAIKNAYGTITRNNSAIISKFKKPKDPKYLGLYTKINYFAFILVFNGLEKLHKAFDDSEGNPSTYFILLKEITGIYVNSINYSPFIDNITSFLTKLSEPNILPTGIFCDYNSEMLINLFLKLQQIVMFDPAGRQTKSINIDNYKTLLESAGVFDTLELISNNGVDTHLTRFVGAFKEVPYTQDASVSISTLNIQYYTELQRILNIYIGISQQQVVSGGSIDTLNNQKGGDLSPNEKNNGSNTLMFDLTTLFMSLTVNLNELTESLASGPVSLDYNRFVDFMKTVPIADTYTDKILEILDNFFRESWFAIQKAEAVGLNTTEHKKLYYTIYIYFACLYGTINDTQTGVLGFINEIVHSRILFEAANYTENIRYISGLIVENAFFNNYIDDDIDEINKIVNSIWFDDNINTFFKTIIELCLTQRYTPPAINNFAMIIFTTLFNFFNYCILASNIPGNATGNDTDNGFNNGRIKINDFTTGGTKFFIFIQRIINTNNFNIIDSQTFIFKEICKLLSIFSSYFYNPNAAFKQISELYNLTGGSKKYTKKIYNKRKHKTRKYNNRKHKTRFNNIKHKTRYNRKHKTRNK